MGHRKETSSEFKINFLISLPTHYSDFVYELHHDQVIEGSIIVKHYPLEQEEKDILQSVYTLFKSSRRIGGTL